MRIKFDWLDILLISQYLFVIYKGDSNSFLIFNQWSFDICICQVFIGSL